jgi:Protein of unknown function (DUF3108)
MHPSLLTPSSLPMRWRTLLALVVAVLLAHWGALFGQLNAFTITSNSARSMSTRTIEAALPAELPMQPAATAQTPKPKITPAPKKPVIAQNKPKTQVNTAQPAIENVASAPPVPADTPPASPPDTPQTPPQPSTEEAASSPPATPTVELALDAQLPSAQPLRESAGAQGARQVYAFPSAGRFEFNAIQVKGAQTQTAFGALDWATDGNTYQLQLESKMGFISLLRQTSVGRISANGLQPERFSDKRFNRSERATHFRRDKGTISFANNKPDAPLLSGAQDQMSFMMQLAGIVGGNAEQLKNQTSVSLQVASSDDADTWVFAIEGEEKITLPAGTTMALHLVRYPRKEFDRRVELWLAPGLDYMPVRIKQTEQNGDVLELLLRSPQLPELATKNCSKDKTC